MTDRMRMGLALGGLASMAAVAGGLWWQGRQAVQPAAPSAAQLRPALAVVPPQGLPAAPEAGAAEG
ncbi:hypothetical protein, partial [Pseudoroseomonas ludipueritiae]